MQQISHDVNTEPEQALLAQILPCPVLLTVVSITLTLVAKRRAVKCQFIVYAASFP